MPGQSGNVANSYEWWKECFREKWDANQGPAQTRDFMQSFIGAFGAPEQGYFLLGHPTVLDWGCAFGDGLDEIRCTFPGVRVAGLDFSEMAVSRARAKYPDVEFLLSVDGTIPREFDVIFTSNCLEHFANPLEIAAGHLQSCRMLYGAMVPYNERPISPSHRAQFREESFPTCIGKFERIQVQRVRSDLAFWNGEQIVVLYGSPEYLSARAHWRAAAAKRKWWTSCCEILDNEQPPEVPRTRTQILALERQLDSAGREEADRHRHLEQQLETARKEAAALHSRLRDAETAVAELHAGAAMFREVYDHHLARYRTQRAWKAMLAIRKAYTFLVRRGWRGRLLFVLGRAPRTVEYDLYFPSIEAYLPAPQRPLSAPAGQWLPRLYDIIILPIIDFDFRFQRPQQIATQFARNGHRVFWISPTRVLPPDSTSHYYARPLRENLWEVQLRGPQCDLHLGELSESACRELSQNLNRLYRDWAVAASCVLVQLPFWRSLAMQLRSIHFSKIVYDCMDDWDAFENLGDFNRSEEVKLTREADVVIVTSEGLREKFGGRGLNPVLVRNGSDFDFFRQASPAAEVGDLRHPVIGYFGAIADWFDLDLVYNVARSRPSYSFVLVGQVFGRDVASLASLPNVRLLGSRPYEAMPSLLAAFDVCMIPFVLNQVTHATDPVKLYEYFSQGKPVVATDMAELRRCGDIVRLAAGPTDFARQLDVALAEGLPALGDKRVEFAKQNSWQERVSGFDRAIQAAFPLVSILIVTHNCAEYVAPCLRSVLRNTAYPNFEVIIVDNASADESAILAQPFAESDSRIRVHRLSKNCGFAAGNNIAAHEGHGEYFVFLNADTIVTPGWLGRLLSHLWRQPTIGVLCAVTNFAGNEAKINIDYGDEHEMEGFAMRVACENRGRTLDVDVAPLFCAGMSRELFEAIGGLDEAYEIGMFEDDDLSLAVRNHGLRVAVAEDCFVHHFGQGSFSKLPSSEYDRVFSDNRRRFEAKWGRTWSPHKPRPHTRPAFEETRFRPLDFCAPESGPRTRSCSD